MLSASTRCSFVGTGASGEAVRLGRSGAAPDQGGSNTEARSRPLVRRDWVREKTLYDVDGSIDFARKTQVEPCYGSSERVPFPPERFVARALARRNFSNNRFARVPSATRWEGFAALLLWVEPLTLGPDGGEFDEENLYRSSS